MAAAPGAWLRALSADVGAMASRLTMERAFTAWLAGTGAAGVPDDDVAEGPPPQRRRRSSSPLRTVRGSS
eukprot:10309544-Prorocentrum_lima.AAC.1